MIVNNAHYLYRNGSFQLASSIVYGDFIDNLLIQDILEVKSIEPLKACMKIKTPFKSFYVSPYDVVETLEGSKRVLELSETDFLVLRPHHIVSTPLKFLDISHLLLNKKLDVSLISKALLDEIDVPPFFLKKALSTGVPETEFYYKNLERYLKKCNLDLEGLRERVLESCTRTVGNKLPINLNLIYLVEYLLTNRFEIEDTTLKLLGESSPYLLKYLDSMNINYEITNNYLICYSQLMVSLFKTEFNNLDFILQSSTSIRERLKEFLKKERFITASLKTLVILQDVYFNNGLLTKIKEFDSQSFILEIVPSDFFAVANSEIILPINQIIREELSQYLEIK